MAFNRDGSLLACAGITDVTNAFAGVGKPAVALSMMRAIKTALERGEHLQDIIDDLLELARDRRPAAEELDLALLLEELHESWDGSLVRVTRRLYDRSVRVPASLVAELDEQAAKAYQVWAVARPANDFAAVCPSLEKLLVPKGGLLARKEDPETRACAAMALGKIRTPKARDVLQRVAQDKEALVRNAVNRALRDVGTGA